MRHRQVIVLDLNSPSRRLAEALVFAFSFRGSIGLILGSKLLNLFLAWFGPKEVLRRFTIAVPGLIPRGAVVLTDQTDHVSWQFRRVGRVIGISYDYFSQRESAIGTIYMPYFPHPAHFERLNSKKSLRLLRSQQKRIGAFFAGTSSDLYQRNFGFPLMSRDRVIASIRIFGDNGLDVVQVTRREDLTRAFERDLSKSILMVLSGDCGDNLEKHILAPDEYLEVLSESYCAICPPGLSMPQCHNLIEALAVGVAPIFNYQEYVHPRMPARVALAFNSPEELVDAIRTFLRMEPGDRIQRSGEVAGFYDACVSLRSFSVQIDDPKVRQIVVNDEGRSVRLLS